MLALSRKGWRRATERPTGACLVEVATHATSSTKFWPASSNATVSFDAFAKERPVYW